MTNAFEVQGEWWLPIRDDHKVPGILRFSSDTGAELTLLGRLRSIFEEAERTEDNGVIKVSMTEGALERSGSYPRIHGMAGQDLCTLDDCLSTKRSILLGGGQATEIITIIRVLKGALFEATEALEATGTSFGHTYLASWIMENGIHETWQWRKDDSPLEDEPRFRLEGYDRPDQQVGTANGEVIRLKHSVGISGDVPSARCLTQHSYWRIDVPALTPMDNLLDLASDIQDLVSVATNETSAFEFMHFWHPDIFHEGDAGKQHPQPVELFVNWSVRTSKETRRLHEHDLLFTFQQFGGIEGIQRWMEVAGTHRGALGRVMATRYAEAMFVSDRLLNCSAALESFDRQRTGYEGSKFKTRLERCATVAGDPFTRLVGDTSKWAEAVRLERDDVAHHFGRRMRTSANETYYLWQSLYWLFTICMLRECGAPNEVFEQFQQHRAYRRVLSRVQEVI